METILFWTLVIAAVAIILMLALLIASERELKRTRNELGRLRSAFESAAAANDARADSTGAEDQQPRAEVAALTEQLQSNQAAIAGMQDEIEALRAENNWLRQQTARHPVQHPEPEAQTVESAPSPQVETPTVRAAGHRVGERRQKTRRIYAAAVVVLLLSVAAAIYFTDAWRSKAFDSADLRPPPPVKQPVDGNAKPEDAKAAVAAPEKPPQTITSRPATAAAKSGVLTGTNYRVVRSTRVFSQPSAGSRPLARVEAGMEINVVSVRNDWLEVRSRHGRPSGFIKSDAAIIKDLK